VGLRVRFREQPDWLDQAAPQQRRARHHGGGDGAVESRNANTKSFHDAARVPPALPSRQSALAPVANRS